jgi:branched-chain amino acid transport system ATP-binding protein
MPYILEVERLIKNFGALAAVAGLGMKVEEGEILGIMGPNGAGKTTVFNLLSGILKPDSGRIMFQGRDITKTRAADRCRLGIGRTYQIPKPFGKMTVFENLMVGAVHGGELSERKARKVCNETLDIIGLTRLKDSYAGGLTLLDRKRLELGKALATGPKVLLLDEVAGGLTEGEVEEIMTLIQGVNQSGVTIVWIEHILMMLTRGVHRLLVINAGCDLCCDVPENVMNAKEVQECYLGTDGGD